MNRKKAVMAVIPMIVLLSTYLYHFWQARLLYYGMEYFAFALFLTVASIFCAVYRPIPVKIRSICILYMIVFGIAADVLNLVFDGELWKMLYGSGLLIIVCEGIALLIGYLHGKKVKRQFYKVDLNKTIPQNLRIALLSDIHMGLCVNREKLNDVCEKIEAEQPDLLLLAGDLCDDYTKRGDMIWAIERLGMIPTKYGAYSVFGNHDLGVHGPVLQYTEQEMRHAISKAGIHLLDDETIITDQFILIGRRDSWLSEMRGGRVPLNSLTAKQEKHTQKPILVLDHQPYDAKEAAECGIDVQFSGHTHAGQVWPVSWIGRLSPTFYGLHNMKQMALIVSSGLGGRGNRMRSGCSAEYVMVELIGRV